MTIFEKENFTDHDNDHDLAAISNSKWWQTGHLP